MTTEIVLPAIDGVHYRLDLPFDPPPTTLRGNYRGHWGPQVKEKRAVREAVVTRGQQLGLKRYGMVHHVTVQLVWAPGDRRTGRDADNLWPLLKAAADGLTPQKVIRRKSGPAVYVGLGLVWDDTPAWMTKLAPVILPLPVEKGLWLDVWVHLDNEGAEEDE